MKRKVSYNKEDTVLSLKHFDDKSSLHNKKGPALIVWSKVGQNCFNVYYFINGAEFSKEEWKRERE